MWNLKTLTTTATGVVVLLVAVVSLNIIASRVPVRVDVTHEHVFSLSDGTKRIMAGLDRDVTAKLYFSRSVKDLPVQIKVYGTRVEELLNEYKALSHGHLTVEVLDPRPDTDEEEWAQKYGINAVRLPKGDQMFFGVVFLAGAKEVAIPYFDPRREEFLEYDLSEAMVNLTKQQAGKVGILSSLPVGGGGGASEAEGGGEWAFVTNLRRSYEVEILKPDAPQIAGDLKTVLVIHPKNLSQQTVYALDQYVLGGGRLIVAVDPLSRTDLEMSGQGRQPGQMPQLSSDLDPLLKTWGIAYDKGQMVGDQGLAAQINVGGAVLSYPYFMTLRSDQFSHESVITANLKEMLVAEAGSFTKAAGSTFQFEPLLKTSKDSGQISAQLAGVMPPEETARQLKADGQERVLAALVRGKFKSAFSGQPAGGPENAVPYRAEAEKEQSVLVVGDVDFLADRNAAEKFRFGSQIMIRTRNDNLAFLANAVDYFAGSDDLIAVRSRGHINRPFTRVLALQKSAQVKWQAEEDQLTTQLTDLQKKLAGLQEQRSDGNRYEPSAAQEEEIKHFRDEERNVKSRRREVRKNLREDIEALGRRLLAANLLFVPLATSALGVGVFVRRAQRPRRKASKESPDVV